MKYHLFKTGLCRTPVYAMQQSLPEIWNDLKNKIAESSPEFYQLIQFINKEDLNNLPEKIRFSIWKYANRTRFRATPFGSLATISSFEFSAETCKMPCLIPEPILHHFMDWAKKDIYKTPGITDSLRLFSNTTIYTITNELRYMKRNEDRFELASILSFPELNYIVNACKKPQPIGELYKQMRLLFNMETKYAKQFFQQLVELQLLHSDLQANITGDDYFQRLGLKPTPQADNYIIAQRKFKSPLISPSIANHFPALFKWITENFEIRETAQLTNFKKAFIKRYEGNMVSLAEVLDPETGISYGNFACLEDEELLHLLQHSEEKQDAFTPIKDNLELRSFLFAHIGSKQKIRLENYEQQKTRKAIKFPNTFNALLTLYNDQIILESIGGCTANHLTGRFSIADKVIENNAKKISRFEYEANPDIIFFDVAYQAEGHIDNVNRRKHLYDYELPLLSYSTSKEPLCISDIYVLIRKDEVILYSAKLKKRIVPRIPTAYNHQRSDLALYRFLCDVQQQGLFTGTFLTLSELLPGFNYYPEMVFQNIVLSPEIWKVPTEILFEHQKELQFSALKIWLRDSVGNQFFKTGNNDQQLYFDPSNETDLWSFIHYLRTYKNKIIYISKVYISENKAIKDSENKIYMAEYSLNFGHHETLYAPLEKISIPENDKNVTIKLPGEEWLYFEIYCHPYRANFILQEWYKFIKGINNVIRNWFYIRYNDPSAHLRIRLQLKNTDCINEILKSVKQLVKPLLLNSYIQDFCLKTYFRETLRYQAAPIDWVEQFFNDDSQYCLALLNSEPTNDQLYRAILDYTDALLNIYSENRNKQLAFIRSRAEKFASEMKFSSQKFKHINYIYKKIDGLTDYKINGSAKNSLKIIKRQFKRILSHCIKQNERENMVADLLHLHINRLFIQQQRMHETIIYQLLLNTTKKKQMLEGALVE